MRALTWAQYERLSAAGSLVPVFREVPADLLTPVSAFLSLSAGHARPFLLESVVGGEQLARYSFLGRDPWCTLTARTEGVEEETARGTRPLDGDVLAALRARLKPSAVDVPELPRFTGGAVGWLAYDAVRRFEPAVGRPPAPGAVLARFSFYDSLVAFDHAQQRLLLIAHAEPGSRRAFARAEDVLDRLQHDLTQGRTPTPEVDRPEVPDVAFEDPAGFRAAVSRAQEHIAAGDIFQVVLSRQQRLRCALPPLTLYRALRMVNPSPYMYFLQDGAHAIAGASPEMLVRVEGARVQTRPIAGTRPRGADPAEDERIGQELQADPKERAEHVMLVDLGRNDLGRVCRPGTVAVSQFMEVERFSHVAHLVSTVEGQLAEGKDALDALVAAFPAGTLTGAPKIRAMQIIDELETAPRGLYGGALGYVDRRGNLDFCIAIRTVVVEDGEVVVQAGAGIVADSDPGAEQRETEAKAGAMLAALRLAREL